MDKKNVIQAGIIFVFLCFSYLVMVSDDMFAGQSNCVCGKLKVNGESLVNLYYGEMWNYTSNATAWDFEFYEGVGIYHNLSNLSAGYLNGFTATTADAAHGGSYLTAQYAGKYKIGWEVSCSSDDNKDLYGFMIAKNFDKNTARKCYARRDFKSRNVVGNIGKPCILSLEVGDTLNILIENEVDDDGLNIHAINFNALRIGDN